MIPVGLEIRTYFGKYPWLDYEAISYIELFLNKDMDLFEWGMGGSTCWYADRVKHVYTVESDKFYIEKISGDIKKRNVKNVTIYYKPIKPLKEYTEVITQLDKKFDVIVVDGQWTTRVACLSEAIPFLKDDGILVCDDFDRSENAFGRELLKSWEEIIFKSPRHTTMIYKRR